MKKHVEEAFQEATGYIDRGEAMLLKSALLKTPALIDGGDPDTDPPTHHNNLLLYLTSWPGGRPNGAAIATVLLKSGFDPNQRFDGTGETVLHWAASNRHDADIIDQLLDHGADIEVLGAVIRRGTPLMNALFFGFRDVGARLVDRGASVHNLVLAAGMGRRDLIEKWYQGSGQYSAEAGRLSPGQHESDEELLSVEETDSWSYDAVICALVCQQYAIADWFITHGFKLNSIPSSASWSCLHHAAYSGRLEMAMYLVAKGANLEVREENAATPANYASAHGHPDVMHYLIDMGTAISLETSAALGRLDTVIQNLPHCDEPARLLARTIGNSTDIGKPIHARIKAGRAAVARYLIQNSPGLHLQLVDGKSAVTAAKDGDDEHWLATTRDVRAL